MALILPLPARLAKLTLLQNRNTAGLLDDPYLSTRSVAYRYAPLYRRPLDLGANACAGSWQFPLHR